MTERRHRTVIEVDSDIGPAKRKAAQLEQVYQRLQGMAAKIGVGAAAVGGAAAGGVPGARPGQTSPGPPGPAQPSPPGPKPDPAVRQLLSGQLTSTLLQSFGGGLPGMIAGGGAVAQGMTRALGQQLAKSSNQFLAGIGQSFAGGILGNVVGPLVTVGAAGVSARIQSASQRARVGTMMNQYALGVGARVGGMAGGPSVGSFFQRAQGGTGAGQYGGLDAFLGAAGRQGFMPEEAASIALQWAQSQAYSRGAGYQTALTVARTGAGIGPAAQYAGLRAPGGGGVGGSPLSLIASAQREGIRGAGLDRWLSLIAQHTGAMASQGLDVNLTGMERFIRSLQRTGAVGRQGYRLPQVAAALGRQPAQARQALLGGFGGLGQAAIMAQASEGAGDIMGMLRNIEALQGDPEKVRQAVIQLYGPEIASLFFASQGAPSGMAGAMAGELAAPGGRFGVKTYAPSRGERVRARAVSERLQDVRGDTVLLIKAQEDLTTALHDLGSIFSGFMKWIQSFMGGAQTKYGP